jgi:hypothetical protein
MKSFGIGAAAALLAAWALPAPQSFDEFGQPYKAPRRVTGLFEWEGDLQAAFAERDTFAFIGTGSLR